MRGFALSVADASQAGQARRQAAQLSSELAFNETDAGKVAIVVTEVATNLVKHGHGGDLIVSALTTDGSSGVQVLALDKGPGIENVGESLRDGYSTSGTPGTGLGAVRRLASRFDIHSQIGSGTAVLAELWPTVPRGHAAPRGLEIGAVCVPASGEEVCGDGWAVTRTERQTTILVVDGLGHGALAADAAHEAIRAFSERPGVAPDAAVSAIHQALRSTRGAAVAVAEVDHRSGLVQYAGIGNIAAVIVSPSLPLRHLVSHNGIAGHEARRITTFTYPWTADSTLVMHSDGLSTRWSLDAYPGLMQRHPALIAGVLYRDFTRGRDDATVVAARARGR